MQDEKEAGEETGKPTHTPALKEQGCPTAPEATGSAEGGALFADRAGPTAAADTRKSTRKLRPQGSHPETPVSKAARHSRPGAPPAQPESHKNQVRMLKADQSDPDAPPKKIGRNERVLPGAQKSVAIPLRGSVSAPRADSIAKTPQCHVSFAESGQAGQFAQTDALECRRHAFEANIADGAKNSDFKTAAVLQGQLEALPKTRALGVDAGQGQQYAQTGALQRRRRKIETEIQGCVENKDFQTVASLQGQLEELLAVEAKTQERVHRLQDLLQNISANAENCDYKIAAILQRHLKALKELALPD